MDGSRLEEMQQDQRDVCLNLLSKTVRMFSFFHLVAKHHRAGVVIIAQR
jgi:hypothetical protein